MITKREYIVFVFIVLLNIVLKSLFSDHSPFSYDEIISVKDTLLDFGHIKHEAEWDNNPPFYYYCLWVWHRILPIDEFNTRLLSVLFVSFAVGLTYLFVLRHFNPQVAILSAILFSISNFVTFYSQEARTYSLILLLTIVSTHLFFQYVQKGKIKSLIFLSTVNFLIVYSHYIAGIIICIQFVFVILFFRDRIKVYFPIQFSIILCLVLLRFTKKQFLNILNFNEKGDFWLKKADINDLLSSGIDLFYNSYTACLFVLTLILFIYNYYKRRIDDQYKVKLYCFSVGFLSILLLFSIGLFKPVFLSRYLIFCIPFATIIVFDQLSNVRYYGYMAIFSVVILQIKSLELKKESGTDYKSVAAVVRKYKSPNDVVIINTKDNLLLFQYYYNRDFFFKYKNQDSVANSQNIYGLNDFSQIDFLGLDKIKNIFLLQSFHKIRQEKNSFVEKLSLTHQIVFATSVYKGVEFHIFRELN